MLNELFIDTIADITEHKQLQLEQVTALLGVFTEAILLVSGDGAIRFANDAAARLFCYSPDELTRLNVDSLLPAHLRVAHKLHRATYMCDPKPRPLSSGRRLWAVRKDGEEFHVDANLRPIQLNGQSKVIVSVVDVSERKLDEAKPTSSEERFRLLSRLISETIAEVFWMTDSELGQVFYVSPSYEHIWRRPRHALYKNPKSFFEAIHPEDQSGVLCTFNQQTNDQPFEFEYRILWPDGSVRWIWNRCYTVWEKPGPMRRYVGVAQDITERKHMEREMRFATMVYRAIGEAIMLADKDSRIAAVNPAFTQLTGYTEEDTLGQATNLLKSGRHDRAFYQNMWQSLEKTGHWQGEIWNRRKNGEIYLEWLVISNIYDAQGCVQWRVAMFSEITERKRNEQIIWRQANFDPLTELPNRSYFVDRLNLEIGKAQRSELTVALMFLDLDHFKEVNDTLGHDAGDKLLKEAARRLSSCVRETDTVARLGGDEFTVLLAELESPAIAGRIAQRILRKLAEPFRLGEESASVSASIGITFYPADAGAADVLLNNADQAMYAAKHQGRNGYCYFTAAMQESALNRIRLTADLRAALSNRQFMLVYEPIVELGSGNIVKAEALIRWQHPLRGRIGPAEFIPFAEDTGMIVDIGDWMFREAVRQAGIWRRMYHAELQIGINLPTVQFQGQNHVFSAWLEHLSELGLPGESIVVEITENLLLEAQAAAREKLSAFREAGMQVAIDGFGSGYASLSNLMKFDIDFLKIDSSIIRNLTPACGDKRLCEAVVAMAHKLGLKVIAEGVETQEQFDFLVAAGCDFGQGHWFSKPLPAEGFESLLKNPSLL